MATVEAKQLSATEHDELCCVYAALLLHDAGLEISEERIAKLIKASHNTTEPYYPMVFAKALQGQDLTAVLNNLGAAPAAAPEHHEEAEKKTEKKRIFVIGIL